MLPAVYHRPCGGNKERHRLETRLSRVRRGIVVEVMRVGKRIGEVELQRVHRMPGALCIPSSRRYPAAPALQVC